ncbi:MAG: adenosine deaminase [Candidatus Eisenbacteria bacterium]
MLASDLHVHLDGSLRESTLVEFARAQGVWPRDVDETAFLSRLAFEPGMSLSSCLDRFGVTVGLLQSARALARAASELVQDCYVDGVRHAEVRFCPLLHTRGGMSPGQAVEAVVSGLELGAAACVSAGDADWLTAGVIVSVLEGSSEADVSTLVDLAVEHAGSGVLGVDLAGDEALFDAARYSRPFARAKDAGLGVTVHAGEGHDPSHVVDAIERLGADRIGHGTSAANDARAMELLARSGTTVECCLSSNLHTGAIRTYGEHPLPRFLRDGVNATLTTDNRFFSATSLSREYDLAAEHLSLTRDDLAAVALQSGRAAFLADSERERLVAAIAESVEAELGSLPERRSEEPSGEGWA